METTPPVPQKDARSNTVRTRNQPVTYLNDFQNERRVLEVVLEAEVDVANVLRRLRVVDVHVDQRYGSILPERHLLYKQTTKRVGLKRVVNQTSKSINCALTEGWSPCLRLASDLLCIEQDLSPPDEVDGEALEGPPTAPTNPLPLALLPAALLLPLAPLALLPVDNVRLALDGFNEPAVLLVAQKRSVSMLIDTQVVTCWP